MKHLVHTYNTGHGKHGSLHISPLHLCEPNPSYPTINTGYPYIFPTPIICCELYYI